MGPARALNKAREKRDGRRDRPMVHASVRFRSDRLSRRPDLMTPGVGWIVTRRPALTRDAPESVEEVPYGAQETVRVSPGNWVRSSAQTDRARQWTRGRCRRRCHGPDSRRANRSGAVTDVESWRLGRSLPDADLELEPKRRRGKRETPRGRGRERRFRLLSSGPRLPVARTP